jgi:hypothetical protein
MANYNKTTILKPCEKARRLIEEKAVNYHSIVYNDNDCIVIESRNTVFHDELKSISEQVESKLKTETTFESDWDLTVFRHEYKNGKVKEKSKRFQFFYQSNVDKYLESYLGREIAKKIIKQTEIIAKKMLQSKVGLDINDFKIECCFYENDYKIDAIITNDPFIDFKVFSKTTEPTWIFEEKNKQDDNAGISF